jgi:pimeloyl-ACP methyl ester carboxylesterase
MRESAVLNLGPHGFHHVAYTEWGDPGNPRVLICVHGLTRQGRDFDDLARSLQSEYRVICPDLPGRGRSDWLSDRGDYSMPVYLNAAAALIARAGVEQVDWVGTSLGGIIGMTLAALPKSPIRQMVVNDVGPFIPKAALERIGEYVASDPAFSSLDEAEAWLKERFAGFGLRTKKHWRHLAKHSVRTAHGGGLRLHYDPALGETFKEAFAGDVAFWPVWDAIRCPVLVLRGAESDLLPRETAMEMQTRGPGCELVEIEGAGHAPALMDAKQIAVVGGWLRA